MAGKAAPLFTDADVDEMRQLSDATLDCTCDVFRPSEQVVGTGGTIRRNTGNPPPVLTAVPCRWHSITASERVRAQELAPAAEWWVTFPVGTDVRLGDHLAIHGTVRSVVADGAGLLYAPDAVGYGTPGTEYGAPVTGAFVDTPYTQTMRVVGVPRRRSYLTLWRVSAAPLAPSERNA
jgi:hypothetical protein